MKSSRRQWRSLLILAAAFSLLGRQNAARTMERADLPVVTPITACADLAKADLSTVADTPGVVTSVRSIDTPKGRYCRVDARIAPLILVTVFLPSEHWTQRYLQYGTAFVGIPGPNGYGYAGGCMPALNGEFVVGGNNLGHFRPELPPSYTRAEDWQWAQDPQKRIDYAYRAHHVNVLVARALMRTYYGQRPAYSYYLGCSQGGLDGLVEAQRFPTDFDGVAAGAPPLLKTANEAVFHPWIAQANTRPDGTHILMPQKRRLAHEAVLAHCDTLSGVQDGVLQNPAACHFDPALMQCAAGVADTSGCFTVEEVSALKKLYEGARDLEGHPLHFGLERGGEAQWDLPSTPAGDSPGAAQAALSAASMRLPQDATTADYRHVVFTKGIFSQGTALSSLYDATNTDLTSFAAHGGKLILWHGLSDFQVPPMATLAYYRGVQEFLGRSVSEQFMRLFLLPGVGHCGGGEGYDQIDLLAPLVAWVELKQRPVRIVTGKAVAAQSPAVNPTAGPLRPSAPYATPTPTLSATRPVYPYPYIAHYLGRGDPQDAASYEPASTAELPLIVLSNEAAKLFGPGTQANYRAKDGRLIDTSRSRE